MFRERKFKKKLKKRKLRKQIEARRKRLQDTKASPIYGWMDIDELDWLCENAGKMETIVEIGAFEGRSTIALLRGCPHGTVFSVDPWRGIEGSYREYVNNTRTFYNLVIMKMDSVDAAKLFTTPVDMVFIDGNHEYENVKADIEVWLPRTKKLICGHDYTDPTVPGVKRAVDELVGDVRLVSSIWHKELT